MAAFHGRPLPSAREYLRLSTESLGLPPLDPTPERLRAAETAVQERPCWDVDVPLEEIAAASWPKLVVSGEWDSAPEQYRRAAAAPLKACGRATAERIGAELVVVAGAAHEPHWEQADVVNNALRRTWARAASTQPSTAESTGV
jgi:pimeloyl-ACP methyl ester carboxylesterase